MTFTATQNFGDSVPGMSSGSFRDDAASPAAYTVKLGYAPRHVKVVNLTDRVTFEWFQGMSAGHAYKVDAAGAGTAETANHITVDSEEGTITFGSGIVGQNDQFYWMAE